MTEVSRSSHVLDLVTIIFNVFRRTLSPTRTGRLSCLIKGGRDYGESDWTIRQARVYPSRSQGCRVDYLLSFASMLNHSHMYYTMSIYSQMTKIIDCIGFSYIVGL